MAEDAGTLGFGMTYGMVAVRTGCRQSVSLSHSTGQDRFPPHKHVNDYVCIVVGGGFVEHLHNGSRERRAGTFFLHRAGETHHDEFGPAGATCLSLHFDNAEMRPQLEGTCPSLTRVAVDQLSFELAANSRDELAISSLSAEIMASFHPVSEPRDNGNWIDLVVEAIADEPTRRWSLRELAELAGRHPVHVAKSFRQVTGMSLGAFQRLRRLTRLGLRLRTEHIPLAMLAADFGYCDQAHMNAEFRAAFGTSPGKFRHALH